MAFNFLGTIESYEEFEEFEELVLKEKDNISSRIRHLRLEIDRFNKLLDKFKTADLKMRSTYKKSDQADKDWLNEARSRETLKLLKLDGRNAVDVDDLKKMFVDTIKYKRERNEFKIKRIKDLIEQYRNQITFLEGRKEDYQEKLDLIRNRFDLVDYTEVQSTKPLDAADVELDKRAIPPNAGKEISGTTVKYIILNIDSAKKSITFEYTAPPVKAGDRLQLSGGLNYKIVNIDLIKDSRTLIVKEDLVDENPSRSRATLL